jgi:hypothetical protein
MLSENMELLEHSSARWLGREDIHSVKWLGADLPIIEKMIEEWIV